MLIFAAFNAQEHEETKKALAKATNDLVEVKRESHKRKKLLMTQQQMIQTGANSYNKVSLTTGHHVDMYAMQSSFIVIKVRTFTATWSPAKFVP